jgi:hypothetical protein
LFALFALTHPHPQIMVPLLPAEAAAAEVEKIKREAAQHNISERDLEVAAAELVALAQPAAATELQRNSWCAFWRCLGSWWCWALGLGRRVREPATCRIVPAVMCTGCSNSHFPTANHPQLKYVEAYLKLNALQNNSAIVYAGASGRTQRIASQNTAHKAACKKRKDCKARAEAQVAQLRRLKAERAEAGVGSATVTRTFVNRSRAARRNLNEALRELSYWKKLTGHGGRSLDHGSGSIRLASLPDDWTAEMVQSLINGDMDGQWAGMDACDAIKKDLARQLLTVKAEVERGREQVELHLFEFWKTKQYYAHMASTAATVSVEKRDAAVALRAAEGGARSGSGSAVDCEAQAALLEGLSKFYPEMGEKARKAFAAPEAEAAAAAARARAEEAAART